MALNAIDERTRGHLWQKLLAWTILLLVTVIFAWNVYFSVVLCPPALSFPGQDPLTAQGGLVAALAMVAFAVLCVLIVTFRPENRIGRLCGFIGSAGIVVTLSGSLEWSSCLAAPGPVPDEEALVIWLGRVFSALFLILPMFVLLPLWFPNGQFLSSRWRVFWYVVLALALASSVLTALWPGEMSAGAHKLITNPLGLNYETPAWYAAIFPYVFLPILIVPLIAIASLFLRYRRADGITRRQIQVFALIAVAGPLFLLLVELAIFFGLFSINTLTAWLYILVLTMGWLGYPLAIGVAVLKYRLYDVDMLIRRTLTYALVTGLLLAVFFGSVIVLQRLFAGLTGAGQNELVTVLSTLAIAALFAPVRNWVQGAIDKRFNRKKYDAQKVMERFSQTVRDETDLEKLTSELVHVVQETMQPKSVSVWLRGETGRAGGGEWRVEIRD